MKKDIHPQINTDVTVTCACGNTFTTQSTVPSIQVDICSKCHPFYTGKHKFIDTAGRIDKFKKKLEASKSAQAAAPTKNKKERKQKQNKTLKEMFEEAKN